MPGDTIILQLCTTNDNHMMYGSWDRVCNRQIFFSFWTIFCPFTSLTTQKIKILKKWKTCLSFWTIFCTFIPPNNSENQSSENMKKNLRDIILHEYHEWESHDAWFLRYGAQQAECVFILDHFLLFYPPNNPKNQNFEKWKKHLEKPSFYTWVPQMTITWCMVPEMMCDRQNFF